VGVAVVVDGGEGGGGRGRGRGGGVGGKGGGQGGRKGGGRGSSFLINYEEVFILFKLVSFLLSY
jgi:hypothetical protein